MSNNTVDLSGHLTIQKIGQVTVANQPLASVEGWIYTDTVAFGGRHPFTATGKPADVIITHAKELLPKPDDLNRKIGVTARCKLISHPGNSFLEIKNINFFDTSNPVNWEHFVVNAVKLQGHLTIPQSRQTTIDFGKCSVTSLEGLLATDKNLFGGQHRILLGGQMADLISCGITTGESLPATIGGKLLSRQKVIYVQANFVSLNGKQPNC